MRVSASTFPDTLVTQLAQLTVKQNRLQSQAATGQRVQLPADDPAAVRRVMDYQAEARLVGQYQRNITYQEELAQASFDGIKGLKAISDRAGEIATLAGGGRSATELNAYATEVSQLIKQAVQLANTKFQGAYLFGGTRSDQAPFVAAYDGSGSVSAVNYQGNTSAAQTEIAEGVTLSAQVVGANSNGAGPGGLLADSRAGADFFNHLISLQSHLSAGDVAAITATDQPALGRDEENLITHLGANSAIQARLEAAGAMAENRATSLESQVSKEADADLAETLVRLNQTQNAYRAALQSGALILNYSLLDYLR